MINLGQVCHLDYMSQNAFFGDSAKKLHSEKTKQKKEDDLAMLNLI